MPARLECLTPGAVVGGVVAGQAVTTVAAEWHGTSCVTLTYHSPRARWPPARLPRRRGALDIGLTPVA